MKLIQDLRDTAERIVAAREALECGDVGEANTILYDLEVGLSSIGDDEPRFGLDDFNTIPSFGRGDKRIEAWCRAYLAGVA